MTKDNNKNNGNKSNIDDQKNVKSVDNPKDDAKKNDVNNTNKKLKKNEDSFVLRGVVLIIIVLICIVGYSYIKSKKTVDESHVLRAIKEVAEFDNIESATFDLQDENSAIVDNSDIKQNNSQNDYRSMEVDNQKIDENTEIIDDQNVMEYDQSQSQDDYDNEDLMNQHLENESDSLNIDQESDYDNVIIDQEGEAMPSNNKQKNKYYDDEVNNLNHLRFKMNQKIKSLKFDVTSLRNENQILRDSNRKLRAFVVYEKIKSKIGGKEDFSRELNMLKNIYASNMKMMQKINEIEYFSQNLKQKTRIINEFKDLIPELVAISKYDPNAGFKQKISYNLSKLFVVKRVRNGGNEIDNFINNSLEMINAGKYSELLSAIDNLDINQQSVLYKFKEDILVSMEFAKFDYEMNKYFNFKI